MQIPYTPAQRLYYGVARIRPVALNALEGDVSAQPSKGLLINLSRLMRRIEAEAIDPLTKRVNYAILATLPPYAEYRALVPSLATFDLAQLITPAQRFAFWVNLYNLLMLDVVIQKRIQTSVQTVRGVFFSHGYWVGGCFFSLNDIEQGILRANRGYPALPGGQFLRTDPRYALIMPTLDARLHFALNCASESCPPIAFYSAENLESQLTLATQNFINSHEVELDAQHHTAQLSKIFQWYAPDFGASFAVTLGFGDASPLLVWMSNYLLDAEWGKYVKLNVKRFRVSFRPYNWALNQIPT